MFDKMVWLDRRKKTLGAACDILFNVSTLEGGCSDRMALKMNDCDCFMRTLWHDGGMHTVSPWQVRALTAF